MKYAEEEPEYSYDECVRRLEIAIEMDLAVTYGEARMAKKHGLAVYRSPPYYGGDYIMVWMDKVGVQKANHPTWKVNVVTSDVRRELEFLFHSFRQPPRERTLNEQLDDYIRRNHG